MTPERKTQEALKGAALVGWFNLPRVIAYALFVIADTLKEIRDELRRLSER